MVWERSLDGSHRARACMKLRALSRMLTYARAFFLFTLSRLLGRVSHQPPAVSSSVHDFMRFMSFTFRPLLHFLKRIQHQAPGFDEVNTQSAPGSAISRDILLQL